MGGHPATVAIRIARANSSSSMFDSFCRASWDLRHVDRPLQRSLRVVLESPVAHTASLTLLYFPLLIPLTASSTFCSQTSSSINFFFVRGIFGLGLMVAGWRVGTGIRVQIYVVARWLGWPVSLHEYLNLRTM